MLSEQSFEKQSSVFFKEVSAESDYPKEDLTLKPLSYRRSVYLAHPKSTKRSLPLDQFFEACASQAPFVKAAVVTFVTGVPFLVFLLITLYALPKKTILGPPGSKATIFELSKWLLISWASFMGLLWCGKILAAISTWCCTLSKSWIKFQRLTQTICLRMVLMLWAIVCYAVIPSVFHHSLGTKGIVEHWVQMLQKAFKFLIIAFAIFLVQGIVLELSSIQYIQGWMGPRSQRACDELDTIKQLHELTDPHVSSGNAGYVTKVLKKLLLPVRNDDLYYRISCGQGHPEMWAEYANYIWDSISQGKATVTRFDVDEQLRAMNRDHDPSRGRELFIQLDDSCDGQVILGEVEKLVQRVGLQLNTRAQAQRGIDSLLRKLEVILSVVMCGIIFFVYVQIFEAKFSKDLGIFWAGLTGLSFAFGGVLLEFTNACVFVFGKHPYDVGDYVESKGKKLVVNKIFLTHTNFEEVTDPEERGIVVQISHASLMTEPIMNWTRTLEAVVEKKKTNAEADKIEENEKKESENKEKEEARELILLKTARLRNVEVKE
ncbi:hypothetical protein H2198_004503 [Neophaeococcomyces mojaviensis]|uniref:Uncharacterized protein n=1 Tax=Neophaeococcomyces mojaviensis TaxID=3383035 RepID=A0ACC3A8C4_9EURO|nr:hypothetical protein H2198_004503 [Knufia sp. JES_112]